MRTWGVDENGVRGSEERVTVPQFWEFMPKRVMPRYFNSSAGTTTVGGYSGPAYECRFVSRASFALQVRLCVGRECKEFGGGVDGGEFVEHHCQALIRVS